MMLLFAHSLLTAGNLAESDPHGWILTLTSVSVVFGALLILWILFGLLGKAFTREPGKKTPSPDEAAAIAMALEAARKEDTGGDPETAAAIALALDCYLSESVHDPESYTLTLRPSQPSAWSNPARNFRKKIDKI